MPISGGSGGGGTPFNGGTITQPLVINTADVNDTPLTVNGKTGQVAPYLLINDDPIDLAPVYSADGDNGHTFITAANNSIMLSIAAAAGFTGEFFDFSSNVNPFPTWLRVNKGGFLGIQTHAAPADGDVATGEVMLWFDQTNGAGNTKLMLKGKSADGTVKTASILLA